MKLYIDEAGRGPLAGPLYVAIVFPIKNFVKKDFQDSKKISEKQRNTLMEKVIKLKERGFLDYTISKSSPKNIDKYGLTKSINQAIKKGIKKLAKTHNLDLSKIEIIIDGKQTFGLEKDLESRLTTIVKGDQKNKNISIASIIAKTQRDKEMVNKIHKKYPQYNFAKHKGYGTKEHIQNIKKYGPCEIHRQLFLRRIKQ
ncbi:MAG TPA: ribonuclease HII [Candidatus Absconditabacterales bacterium]|nr:ribonuclease HII [Candidatus Absconditabacterales bacterium]